MKILNTSNVYMYVRVVYNNRGTYLSCRRGESELKESKICGKLRELI